MTQTIDTITRDDLVREMRFGPVQLVNVLEQPAAGALRLVPGSKHIPLSELAQRLGELDRDVDVVVYCSNVTCQASRKAAELLLARGFRVRRFAAGIEGWVQGGGPTELGAHA